jgi:hypothetical protein
MASVPIPKFAASRGIFVVNFGIEGRWQPIDLVWLWI